jgi:hypothetical protein
MCRVFSTPHCSKPPSGRTRTINALNLTRSTNPTRQPSPSHNLITRRPRSLLILPQSHQQIPKLPLLTPARPALTPLPTQIHQLRNPLPARSTSRRILSSLQELFSITSRGRNRLFFLRIIVLVEIIDVLLCCFDGFLFAFFGAGFSLLEGEVTALAPLLDDGGFVFEGAGGGVVGWLVGG